MLYPASRLKINNEIIILNLSTKLYGHHLMAQEKYRFKKILAEVVPHPLLEGRSGLKNLSKTPWVIKTRDGKQYTIDFGKSFTIEDGTMIQFGEVEGMIRKG